MEQSFRSSLPPLGKKNLQLRPSLSLLNTPHDFLPLSLPMSSLSLGCPSTYLVCRHFFYRSCQTPAKQNKAEPQPSPA